MGKYTCEKCGKEFKQKSHYTTHQNKKNPCVVESKIKEIIDTVVKEKMSKIKIKLQIGALKLERNMEWHKEIKRII
jgi:uncharacterized C2H2 Zn-finger protein